MRTLNIKYGLIMLLGFVGFFFLMKAFGLYTNTDLRLVNVLIHGTVVYLAMKAYRDQTDNRFRFWGVFLEGVKTSIIPVFGFAIFISIYMGFMNPSFMDHVQETVTWGEYLTPLRSGLFLVFEGIIVTMLTSYIGMRFLSYQENVPSPS